MEYIIEFILELCLECGLEASKNKKVPKPIRHLILSIILILFVAVIGIIYLTAFLILKQSIIGFLLFFILATFMLVSTIIKFKKEYLNKKIK